MKRTPRYTPPRKPPRARHITIQVALTGVVVIFAVVLVVAFMVGRDTPTASGDAAPIRIGHTETTEQNGTIVAVYSDYLCPHCAQFDQEFRPALDELLAAGTIAVDYYPVAILDTARTQHFSSRAAAAAYCVADDSLDAFQRFHTMLYTLGSTASDSPPTDTELITLAHQAGAGPAAADCISNSRYEPRVRNLANANGIRATPTVRVNGQDYAHTTPEALKTDIANFTGTTTN